MKSIANILLFITSCLFVISCNSGAEGDSANTGAATTAASGKGDLYTLNEQSLVNWEGFKPASSHRGTINIKEGSVRVSGKDITGGKFVLDMASIDVTDLSGEKKSGLEGHLKSGDFFDLEKYKTANFEITKVVGLKGDNTATHMIYGNLQIKDVTKNIAFKTVVTVKDGTLKAVTPKFKIDRTDWNVKYNSSKFSTDVLKDKIIKDHIDLSISFTAKKA